MKNWPSKRAWPPHLADESFDVEVAPENRIPGPVRTCSCLPLLAWAPVGRPESKMTISCPTRGHALIDCKSISRQLSSELSYVRSGPKIKEACAR